MRKGRLSVTGLTAFSVILATSPATAQSYLMYAADKEVVLEGTVKDFQYSNPHAVLEMMVPGPSGTSVQWDILMPSPIKLSKAGIAEKALQPGDKVSVLAHPLKDGGTGGSLIEVMKQDGSILSLNPGASRPALRLVQSKP
jgi:hypothetical protein